MTPWNPHRRQVADSRRAGERASVLAQIRRRGSTAKELARRLGLSMFQVRRALKALRREMLVTWLPDRTRLPRHAYTRVYLATSGSPRAKRRAARARSA